MVFPWFSHGSKPPTSFRLPNLWASEPLSVGRSGPGIIQETSPWGGRWERGLLLHVLLGQHALVGQSSWWFHGDFLLISSLIPAKYGDLTIYVGFFCVGLNLIYGNAMGIAENHHDMGMKHILYAGMYDIIVERWRKQKLIRICCEGGTPSWVMVLTRCGSNEHQHVIFAYENVNNNLWSVGVSDKSWCTN